MKAVLLGHKGQLGKEISSRARAAGISLCGGDLPELNILDQASIETLLEAAAPAIVINTAAYTAVDKAETERDAAFAVNAAGAANVARACKRFGCRVIHISTDYVFGPGYTTPIAEDAATAPINVYGASKLAGEREVIEILGDAALVVRTSSLHGQYGPNFVQTMLDLFASRPEVCVVSDQIMSPTWAGWLAEVTLRLAARPDCSGIVHACSGAEISWFEFAHAVWEDARERRPHQAVLRPIGSADFKRPAKRAAYSAMCVAKLEGWLGEPVLGWREGLRSHLRDLGLWACAVPGDGKQTVRA